MSKFTGLGTLLSAAILILLGCGTSAPNCILSGLTVSPASATEDHVAVAPGNQVQFFASPVITAKGCAIAACLNCSGQTWTVSDAVNVSISNNALDNGMATCLGPTNGAVTVTATAPVSAKSSQTVTGTSALTCK